MPRYDPLIKYTKCLNCRTLIPNSDRVGYQFRICKKCGNRKSVLKPTNGGHV